MVLADLGAEVCRIERPDKVAAAASIEVHDDLVAYDLLSRGRRSAGIDLKHPDGAALIRRLVGVADVFVEGFRPGVAERLGIGPEYLFLVV
jgi:alpha-methylacyl-CoA racemase